MANDKATFNSRPRQRAGAGALLAMAALLLASCEHDVRRASQARTTPPATALMPRGGAIGPALMDQKWIYGSSAAAIHAAILDGRPNGMPSFRDKIQDDDAWKIAAYVRSLSGLDTRPPEGSTSLPLRH